MPSCASYNYVFDTSGMLVEYDIFGEGSQILTNQKRKKHCFLASDWLEFGIASLKLMIVSSLVIP